MRIRSYAKINWSLRITGKRPDGFHDLETLFQTVSLYDELTFEPADRFSLTCDDPSIPLGESNLIVRAVRALSAPPVAVHLEKRIPAGGGLGGGSSNAAATLLAMDRMFELHTRRDSLERIALELGSDVPFFLAGGTSYAIGRGEVLTPLPSPDGVALLLLLPDERVATAEAFRTIQSYSRPIGIERYRSMLDGDFLGHAAELVNDFEAPVFARIPKLRSLKERLYAAGAAWAGMSGSGSTIVGAFRSGEDRDRARAQFGDVRAEGAGVVGA